MVRSLGSVPAETQPSIQAQPRRGGTGERVHGDKGDRDAVVEFGVDLVDEVDNLDAVVLDRAQRRAVRFVVQVVVGNQQLNLPILQSQPWSVGFRTSDAFTVVAAPVEGFGLLASQ